MIRRKAPDLTLEPLSKVGLVLGSWLTASSDQVHCWKALSQRGPDPVLNDQNITLGIWTKGQVEPVRQLVSENSVLQLASPRYNIWECRGGVAGNLGPSVWWLSQSHRKNARREAWNMGHSWGWTGGRGWECSVRNTSTHAIHIETKEKWYD